MKTALFRLIAALFLATACVSVFAQDQGPETPFFFSTAFTAYRSYPTGTVFEENWAGVTPNPDLCWTGGPMGCNQTWAVTAGSGESVVAAPAGFSSPDVLYVPSGATTQIAMNTSGTIPGLPAAGPYTISFQIESSSYATSGGLVSFANGTNIFLTIGQGYGTGFWITNGNPCGGAAGTVNTLSIFVDGDTSTYSVNGTQCGSDFTPGGTIFNQLSISGQSGSNVWVGPITITSSTITGGWWPTTISDWAGQSGTPTAASLFAGTHGWYASDSWSNNAANGITYAFVNGCQPYQSSIKIWGGSYSGNSCVSLQMQVPTTAGANGGWVWGGQSTQPNESVGFFFQFSVPGAVGFTWTDISGLFGTYNATTGATKIDNVQLALDSGVEHIHCETDEGPDDGTSSTIDYPLAQNTWYWITYDTTPSGSFNAWLYSGSGAYLGTCAFPASTGTISTEGFSLRKEGSETEPVAGTVTYSNVLFSFADAPAPLLPPGFPEPPQ